MGAQSINAQKAAGAFEIQEDFGALVPSSKYQQEIADGIRSKTGARHLKKLNGKHLMCIALHMDGKSQKQIAETMGMSQPWVSTLLADPLAQAQIKNRYAVMDQELRALGPRVVGVLRNAITGDDPVLAMQAADKWLRAHGYYDKNKGGGSLSAEDIVAELMRQTKDGETSSLTISVNKRGTTQHLPAEPSPFAGHEVIEHTPMDEFLEE